MKTNFFFYCLAVLMVSACSKNDNTKDNPGTPENDTYINTTAGSTWSYHTIDSAGATPAIADYTLTATSRDTSINERTYHIYDYSYGGNQYLNLSSHAYYQYDSIPGGLGAGVFERIYLKDDAAAGTSWKQDFSVTIPGNPLALPVTVTNTISEKGITRTVNGTNYTDVIHVTTNISSTFIPAGLTTNINSYYAKNYGLIENSTKVDLDFLGFTQNVDIGTKLTSAALK